MEPKKVPFFMLSYAMDQISVTPSRFFSFDILFILFLKFMFEREGESMSGRRAERGRQKVRSELHVDSTEPNEGLQLNTP